LITNGQPNRIYEIDEAGGASVAAPRSEPRSPHFQDVTSLLNHVHSEEPFDDFERQPLLPYRLSQLGPGVSWFDVDDDGWDELIVSSGRGGALGLFRNDRQGGFMRMSGAPCDVPVTRDQTTVLGWRRPDGRTVLVAGSANYEEGLASGGAARYYDLSAKTVEDALPGQAASTGPLAMADVNGDGQLDLFLGGRVMPGRYPEPGSSLLFRGSGATFELDAENTKGLAGVGLVSGAVFTDVDGDGDPDLVLACEWGPLRVFRNDRGRLTEVTAELGFDKYAGWWNGVTAGDFDGDGRLDLAASNWGRNTKYENWRAQALRVFCGDLDGNGSCDVVESYFDVAMRRLVPSQQFHILAAAMPTVRERLGTWQAYAAAGLEDIWGDALKQAREWWANCLETMVFLNRGDHFEARELPLEAQFAPAFAVAVGDLDGDGCEDLFLSQNFFAVHPDTPRHDAGRSLWLRGDNQGGFRPVAGQQSGLLVYGEQRGAALCDYDGDGRVDLAVSQNAGPTRLFHNRGAQPGLRVRLRGPAGNPAAVGASLRLLCGQRQGPVREIHAGSGYWSQDSSIQVLAAMDTPVRLWVRWPGGTATTSDVPPGVKTVEVQPDGRLQAR
jgi:hypothetical protein